MDTTPEIVLDSDVRAFLREEISTKHVAKAETFVGLFSYKGQLSVASLLVQAEKAGKIERALELLDRFYDEHWYHEHPDIRGDAEINRINKWYLERVYAELGITPPWKRDAR